jgi:hypothetical protein
MDLKPIDSSVLIDLGRSEYNEQCAIFRWAKIMEPWHPELALLSGSLNGVRISIGQAMKAKRAGMKTGYPDLSLPVPRGIYHGLFIELKAGKNRPTTKQKQFLKALHDQGNYAVACRGADAAIAVITQYLEGKL